MVGDLAALAAQWLPWVLPILVAVVLVLARMLFARTKEKMEASRKEAARKPYDGDLTPAMELQETYREVAREKLMKEIRDGQHDVSASVRVVRYFDAAEHESFPSERSAELEPIVASVRLFQFLDAEIIAAIAQASEVRRTKKGEVLFGRDCGSGQYRQHKHLQVLLKGRVEVVVGRWEHSSSDSSEHRDLLSVMEEGQTITSMITMLEAITLAISLSASRSEEGSKPQTPSRGTMPPAADEDEVTASVTEPGVLLQVPLSIFNGLQRQFPQAITRLARMIVLRLQRVTLLTVNHHFGLSKELVLHSGRRMPVASPNRAELPSEENRLQFAFDMSLAALSRLMGISRDAACMQVLRQNLQVEQHSPGSIVMAQVTDPRALEESQHARDACDPCLYFIVCGRLAVYLSDEGGKGERGKEAVGGGGGGMDESSMLYMAAEGDTVGQLSVVTGDFYYRVVAKASKTQRKHRAVVLGKLRKEAFDTLVGMRPTVIGRTIFMISLQLAPVVKQVDYALEWEQRHAGEVVCHETDETDGMYVVLSGRLRAYGDTKTARGQPELRPHRPEAGRMREGEEAGVVDDHLNAGVGGMASMSVPGGMSLFGVRGRTSEGVVVAEYGKGESFGALEVLTDMPRPTTVLAVRDTELAKISSTMFKFVIKKYPQVVVQFSKIVGNTMKKQLHQMTLKEGDRDTATNISTVAVVGVNETVPVTAFCRRLASELQRIVPCLHLDKSTPMSKLGKSAFSAAEEAKLISWLGEMEEKYNVVLYECDVLITPWTQRCLRQADLIFVVGWGHGNFRISEVERYLLQNTKQTSARKELVLLHPQSPDEYASCTFDWLKLRQGWCSAWHHVRFKMPAGASRANRANTRRMNNEWHSSNFIPSLLHNTPLNTSISGLIKRGAGGIWNRIKHTSPRPVAGQKPKDDVARLARLITGTAVGLVLGGGGARGLAHVGVIKALEEAGIPIDMVGGTSMGSMIGAMYAKDPDFIDVLTLSRRISRLMGNKWRQVLDLTYPRVSFMTGAAFNEVIQAAFGDEMQIEDMWLSYYAITCNISHSRMIVHRHGSVWKYVRASMSLVGFLPPVCDEDGSLLVDGGYINNLPADVMRALGVSTIIAVDVGSEVDTNYHTYGDSLSGWWLLLNKLNPFAAKLKIPNLSDIQAQLAYVSSVKLLEDVKEQPGCIYWRPPVNSYGTLEFNRFDEISDVGYQYAKGEIEAWRQQGGKGAPFAWLATQKDKVRTHKRTKSLESLQDRGKRLSF